MLRKKGGVEIAAVGFVEATTSVLQTNHTSQGAIDQVLEAAKLDPAAQKAIDKSNEEALLNKADEKRAGLNKMMIKAQDQGFKDLREATIVTCDSGMTEKGRRRTVGVNGRE